MAAFDDILLSLNTAQAELTSTWQDIAAVWQDSVAHHFSQQIVHPLENELSEIRMALESVANAIDEFHASAR